MGTMLAERPAVGAQVLPEEDMQLADELSLLTVQETDRAVIAHLARPEKCNALSLEVIQELDILVQRLLDSGSTRPFVLRGSGKWFSSGGDLREFATFSSEEAVMMARIMTSALRGIESLPGPTIAALNGPAIGGGVELALAFDLRVASASSYLRFAQTRIGITTGWQGIERLCGMLGYSTALYWMLTGMQISAQMALRVGLVNAVFGDETFDEELDGLIDSLLEAGPAGLAIKRILRDGVGRPALTSGELEQHLLRMLWERPERLVAMTDALKKSRTSRS